MGLDITGLGAVFDFGSKVLERIFPDPTERLKAQTALEQMKTSGELAQLAGQMEINKVEAASTNWFIAGWRPFVGWVCGVGLAYVAIIEPIMRFGALAWFGYKGQFPVIDTSLTMQVLLGMLGLAGIRGYEKTKGVAR